MAKKKASTKDSKKKAPSKATRTSGGAKPAARPPLSARPEAATKSSGAPRAGSAKPARPRAAGNPVARGPASPRARAQEAPAGAARAKTDGAQLKKIPAKPTNQRLSTADLSRIRSVLAQKRLAISNHLQNELTELEKPEKRHRADLEEIASDTHDTDSLCEIMDIETTQIDQIEMALA